ncbi:MAG: class E sortase [Oscillospiraceae bacterium]|nr:class E sortase [Oscillospiraceae bacterium]
MQFPSLNLKKQLPTTFFKKGYSVFKAFSIQKKSAIIAAFTFIVLVPLLCGMFLFPKSASQHWRTVPLPVLTPPPQSVAQEEPLTADTIYYPTDTLFLSPKRQAYVNGTMLLTVPRLKLENIPVQNGTTTEVLAKGVGLYEVSSMPSKGNPNVCIAGHRGVHGSEFANIDTFAPEDKIYLEYEGYRYTYLFEKTVIVEDDDWSPIFCTDDSRITLTSCHPKTGPSTHRICATGLLISVDPV